MQEGEIERGEEQAEKQRLRGEGNLRNWEKTRDKANGLTLESRVEAKTTVDFSSWRNTPK